jgi:hypothetical protein
MMITRSFVGSILSVSLVLTPLHAQSLLRPQFNARETPTTVEYRLSGSVRSCSVTLETGTGGIAQADIAVPNSIKWAGAKPGQFLYVSCQIRDSSESGTLLVEIYTDGILRASDEAVGFPHIATARGSYMPLVP